MKLYLDTAPLIYSVEGIAPWAAKVQSRIAVPSVQVVTSDLSILECRVRPLRLGQQRVLKNFDQFFQEGLSEMIPLLPNVMLKAAELRARYSWLRTPDAIHLAAAIIGACDVFLTNDQRLGRCSEMPIEVLQ